MSDTNSEYRVEEVICNLFNRAYRAHSQEVDNDHDHDLVLYRSTLEGYSVSGRDGNLTSRMEGYEMQLVSYMCMEWSMYTDKDKDYRVPAWQAKFARKIERNIRRWMRDTSVTHAEIAVKYYGQHDITYELNNDPIATIRERQ